MATGQHEDGFAPGAQLLVRDEVWLVRGVTDTPHDGKKIVAVGMTGIVRDQEATFFTRVDTDIQVLQPEDTTVVADTSENFRTSRLFLEAVLRKTPLPQSERGLAMTDKFVLKRNPYQQRPAELALSGLRPRVLIADVVGLGKTLEIGLTLAELIRRGRGERILVVTPQQVLEQFQRELWTRFSIPLIRLDSLGIQRIQRDIPAGRNPFTYYKRVIISVDTLKHIGRYRHHLQNIHWDAVVIDESHNLMGGRNLRAQLAKELAPRADALLLASATPHNGDRRSFADLIDLLDPAAIADRDKYKPEQISHLYIRRTKISPEVRDHIQGSWADRGPSQSLRCAASEPEEKVFAELAQHWLDPEASAASGKDGRLFPFNLLKSFLSSHRALAETAATRIKTLTSGEAAAPKDPGVEAERVALERLRALADAVTDDESAKLAGLVNKLVEIGVGPGKPTRVVVFSERVPTLKWLAAVVPAKLGFGAKAAADAVRVMHGGVSDQKEQEIIEEFGLASSPVRLLFTGDVASEGVNLHQQCHHLIHYDLPWSLIRIEQRNGRIDRFGQLREPQFTALILTSAVPDTKDDTTVAEKLLVREAAAHASLGTAETVTGLYDARLEEDRLTKDLLMGKPVEERLAEPTPDDLLADLLAPTVTSAVAAPPVQVALPTLFESTEGFVTDAIRDLYGSRNDLEIRREGDRNEIFALTPPDDLLRRLKVLPPSVLKSQRMHERLRITFDQRTAQEHLDKAHARDSAWPTVGFASDLHPFVEWLVDKVLVRVGRLEAPVLRATVDQPTFLVQGIYSNALGKPTVVEWMAVSGLPGAATVRPMFDALAGAGVGPTMPNPLDSGDLSHLQMLVPAAVAAARGHLEIQQEHYSSEIEKPLAAHLSRLDSWKQLSLFEDSSARRREKITGTVGEQEELVRAMRTSGAPFVRLLAVLEGRG